MLITKGLHVVMKIRNQVPPNPRIQSTNQAKDTHHHLRIIPSTSLARNIHRMVIVIAAVGIVPIEILPIQRVDQTADVTILLIVPADRHVIMIAEVIKANMKKINTRAIDIK